MRMMLLPPSTLMSIRHRHEEHHVTLSGIVQGSGGGLAEILKGLWKAMAVEVEVASGGMW